MPAAGQDPVDGVLWERKQGRQEPQGLQIWQRKEGRQEGQEAAERRQGRLGACADAESSDSSGSATFSASQPGSMDESDRLMPQSPPGDQDCASPRLSRIPGCRADFAPEDRPRQWSPMSLSPAVCRRRTRLVLRVRGGSLAREARRPPGADRAGRGRAALDTARSSGRRPDSAPAVAAHASGIAH